LLGQVLHTVKYADDLMLLAKEETLLQKMIARLIEIVRCMKWTWMWEGGGP